DSETRRVPLDVFSVILSALGFGGVLYGLSTFENSAADGVDPATWVALAVGAVALAVFVTRQVRLQRRDRALLDLRPFTYRTFLVALIVNVLLFMCMLGAAAILLPLYLQQVLGTSPFTSGLALLPGGLVLGLLGRPVGALYDRFGARPLVIPGTTAMAIGLWLFAIPGVASSVGLVITIHLVFMAGLGLMMSPLMTESLGALPDHLYSHGSALLTTLQQVAGAFGTALFVTIAALGSADPTASSPDGAGLHSAFTAAGIVGVVAFAAALCIRRKQRPVS